MYSVLIGLTLAVDEEFIVLFIVLVFHRGSSYSLMIWGELSVTRNLRGTRSRQPASVP